MKRLKLVLVVTYNDNGVPVNELKDRMEFACVQHPMGDGLFTGETDAEIEGYSMAIEEQTVTPTDPPTLSEAMKAFLSAELANCELAGTDPRLYNASDSLAQMPPDVLQEIIGHIGADVTFFHIEFDQLITRYGQKADFSEWDGVS